MKTLFLDFDGVLHPTLATPKQLFGLAHLLVEAVDRWNPQIVISSSWRFHFTRQEILSRLPSALATRVRGTTGDAYVGRHARWNEIQAYCRQHPIADWRALDDSAYEFPASCVHLIHCDGARGVMARQIDELNAWLGSTGP